MNLLLPMLVGMGLETTLIWLLVLIEKSKLHALLVTLTGSQTPAILVRQAAPLDKEANELKKRILELGTSSCSSPVPVPPVLSPFSPEAEGTDRARRPMGIGPAFREAPEVLL